jgi:hypothetical protein
MATENQDTGDDQYARLKKSREQATIWGNRAAMAWQQCNLALVEQALRRMWQYQVAAANIEGKEPPEGPPDPEEYFKDRGQNDDPPWRPYDPSRVPNRPAPSSGSSYRSLPLPSETDDDD